MTANPREGEEGERVGKYHGLGNDLLILDRRASGRDLRESTVRQLCDRRRGIGADGVLVLLPSRSASARMVVHNADGSIAEMCGNGIRCVVKYLVERSGQRPAELPVETDAGLMSCAIEYQDGEVNEGQFARGTVNGVSSPGGELALRGAAVLSATQKRRPGEFLFQAMLPLAGDG